VIDVDLTGKKFLPCHTTGELRFEVSAKIVAGVAKDDFPMAASLRAS
jgi:hypothetical protein